MKDNEKKREEPRILVISNNPLDHSSSNGQTLLTLLNKMPKEKLANFYISPIFPNERCASTYYRVTDKEALSLGILKKIGKVVEPKEPTSSSSSSGPGTKKTPFKLLLRNFLWDHCHYQNKDFRKWLDDFKPEGVLLQLGDSPFLCHIAERIASSRHIPLFVWNTENYPFKEFDYTDLKKEKPGFLYNRFRKKLNKRIGQMDVSCWMHLTEGLKEKYEKAFGGHHEVVSNCFDLETIEKKNEKSSANVFYFGNLGLGRAEMLAKLSRKLKEANEDSKLIVYGRATEEQIVLFNSSSIEYRGFHPMNEVHEALEEEGDFVCHVESTDEERTKDLIDAFSTKIPNCLHLGLPFIVYAPECFEFVKYLKRNDCAFLVDDEDDSVERLRTFLDDGQEQDRLVKNALSLANKNHNPEINGQRALDIFIEGVEAKQ